MLSKIFFFKEKHNFLDVYKELYVKAVGKYFFERGRSFLFKEETLYGTLGFTFAAVLDGKDIFIKTHPQGKFYKRCVLKEFFILKHLYGSELYLEYVEIEILGGKQGVILIEALLHLEDQLSIFEIQNLVKSYAKKLSPQMIDMKRFSYDSMLNIAFEANLLLRREGMITKEYFYEIKNACHYMKNSSQQIFLCHGDLSNVNLLKKGTKIYPVDWEDAFFGPKNYDLIYWLTFFEQRKFYALESFEGNKIFDKNSKRLFLLIILLKCYLSFLRKDYLNHTLSFNERLGEVIKLFEYAE